MRNIEPPCCREGSFEAELQSIVFAGEQLSLLATMPDWPQILAAEKPSELLAAGVVVTPAPAP
jgi:hypothetical protein